MITSQFKVIDIYRKLNFNVSGTNPADPQACLRCLDAAMIVFC